MKNITVQFTDEEERKLRYALSNKYNAKKDCSTADLIRASVFDTMATQLKAESDEAIRQLNS